MTALRLLYLFVVSNCTMRGLTQLKVRKYTDITAIESEKPVVYTLEEIAEATGNFDESRKIGEGGYGSVYLGIMGKQVSLL